MAVYEGIVPSSREMSIARLTGRKDLHGEYWAGVSGGDVRARHNLSGEKYQEAFNDYEGNHGMQLLDVSGYGAGGVTYAALWMKVANAPAWQARHGMTA
jgi:hypothetical protein